jgi:hypothetical protein
MKTRKLIGKSLWEILVPALDRLGFKRTVQYHNVWDGTVRTITGGLTIMPPARGEWVCGSEDGTIFKEPMIPVRVWATRKQMDKIAEITMEHYDQLAVMFYHISDEVLIVSREKTKK